LGERSRAPKKTYVPEEVEFRTKPQIALAQIDRTLVNGICVAAWTFDEFYGRDRAFLDGLQMRSQAFVGEIPGNFHGWVQKPTVLRTAPRTSRKCGRKKRYPRVARRRPSCEVRNLLKHSPVFRDQSWQCYRIKDNDHGPVVWEVKWAVFWRKDAAGLPTRRHCLIVARNVLSGEVKYFLSNRVPGERNPLTGQYVTLRWLLRVAFGRWSIESCFRQGKDELGLDHYEVRGWRCVHRHFYITQLSHLFCARVRQEYDPAPSDEGDRLSVEQVRSAINVWLDVAALPPKCQRQRFEKEQAKQQYYQRRNKQARVAHTKTRRSQLNALGIDVDRIKSCLNRKDSP
jgi:SRSO17 transposase